MTELNGQTNPADQVTRAELASIVDHTLLKTDATPDQVVALLDEAKALFRAAWEKFYAGLSLDNIAHWHHQQDAAARHSKGNRR